MTPARSLAASVVALGFAGSFTATPAYAAPAPCEHAENFAAQSGAELLRIVRLEIRKPAGAAERPQAKDTNKDHDQQPADATDRIFGADATPLDPTDETGEDSDTLSEGIGMLGSAVLDSVVPGGTAAVTDPDAPWKTLENAHVTRPVAAKQTPQTMVGDVGLGESQTAVVSTAPIKSAAVARILDGTADGTAALSEPLLQQAPPTNNAAAARTTPAGQAGPIRVDAGQTTAHALWDDGMACGSAAGEAARAATSMHGATLLGSGDTALVRVPESTGSEATTALERSNGIARTVASATAAPGRIDVAGGRVQVRVMQAPTLVATMSPTDGKIDYRPAQVEVSGDGIATKRLTAAGESVDVKLGKGTTESGIAGIGEVLPGSAPALPTIPGLPQLGTSAAEKLPPLPPTESASTGTRVRISLGRVRQARQDNVVAARATAIQVSVTAGAATRGRGNIGYGRSTVSLDLAFGVLEAAAVAPEAAQYEGTSGSAGGLPITGPRVIGLAAGGLVLLVTGIAAVTLSVRRRRTRP